MQAKDMGKIVGIYPNSKRKTYETAFDTVSLFCRYGELPQSVNNAVYGIQYAIQTGRVSAIIANAIRNLSPYQKLVLISEIEGTAINKVSQMLISKFSSKKVDTQKAFNWLSRQAESFSDKNYTLRITTNSDDTAYVLVAINRRDTNQTQKMATIASWEELKRFQLPDYFFFAKTTS